MHLPTQFDKISEKQMTSNNYMGEESKGAVDSAIHLFPFARPFPPVPLPLSNCLSLSL